jgi:hypothetical protein
MRVPAWRPVLSAATLLSSLLVAGPAAADGVSIRVAAGLDGAARAGRWMPVRVTLENQGAAASGDLVVRLGDARAVRAIDLPSPSRKTFDLYLRVPPAAEPIVVAQFGGATARQPIRLAADDGPFRLCVGTDPGNGPCAATIETASLPRSWRAYDAADEVFGLSATGLDGEQRTAFERWRAGRHWANSTNMAPPVTAPSASGARTRAPQILTAYVALLALAAIVAPMLRVRRTAVVLLGVLTVAASAAVFADGRVGAAAAIGVDDAIVLRSGVGFAGTSLVSRGTATFPSAAAHTLRAAFPDGWIEARDAGALRREFDADGRLVVGGGFARSQRLVFEIEGFLDAPTLSAEWRGTALVLANVSPFDLTGCALPEGYAPRQVARFTRGSRIEVSPAEAADPVLTCRVAGVPETVTSGAAAMRHNGEATLVFDLRPLEPAR